MSCASASSRSSTRRAAALSASSRLRTRSAAADASDISMSRSSSPNLRTLTRDVRAIIPSRPSASDERRGQQAADARDDDRIGGREPRVERGVQDERRLALHGHLVDHAGATRRCHPVLPGNRRVAAGANAPPDWRSRMTPSSGRSTSKQRSRIRSSSASSEIGVASARWTSFRIARRAACRSGSTAAAFASAAGGGSGRVFDHRAADLRRSPA